MDDRSSDLSPSPDPAEGSPSLCSPSMPHFSTKERYINSQDHSESGPTLPDDYTSWSSLRINQMKKQKVSSNKTATVTKEPNSSYYTRRRAQNRASQRAFRERKERHVKGLEQQLEDLHQQYEDLLSAYDHQKEQLLHLRAELQDCHSDHESNPNLPRINPLHFSSTGRSDLAPAKNGPSQMRQDESSFMLQPQSMTPDSNFDRQNSASRASVSEERTPFGSLLPLTPAPDFDSSAMFRAGDSYLAAEDSFASPDFSKDFVINPSVEMLEGWS